jgi:hypothetical protein
MTVNVCDVDFENKQFDFSLKTPNVYYELNYLIMLFIMKIS